MNAKKANNTGSLKADVVVIGSGGGLGAAVAAAEGGSSVILLEKEGITGGWTRQANAMLAVESPLQKRQNVTITADDIFKRFVDYHHCYRINPRVVRAYYNRSGDTIRWLEEKGVEFELQNNAVGLAVVHMPSNMMASVQNALYHSAQKLGVNILLHTSGKKIIRKKNGKVAGVIAIKEGEEFEIQTDAVVIATGGFGANRELLKKYCPDYYDDMQLWTWPPHFEAHSGDGIYMAEEIGAGMADWVPIYHRAAPDFGGYPWKPNIPWSLNGRMMWVNKKGKRFIDEIGTPVMYAGNILFSQPGKLAYALFADDLVQFTESEGSAETGLGRQKHSKLGGGVIIAKPVPVTGLREKLEILVDKTGLKIADSWDDIANWIGCDPKVLKAEINEYNSFCDKRHDAIFVKDPKALIPLRKPPYYGIRIYGDVGETLGGIIVDENMAVLDKQANVIPGVFAAGVVADGHQGQTYDHDALSGSAVGFAVVSGHIAGESAARYIKTINR